MILEGFPQTELEFHARFSSEEACRDYWLNVRWPNGVTCPHCGCTKGKRRKGREEWQCGNTKCRREVSPRAGTVLHNSAKPLRAWLLAMYHMSVNKQAMSALRLQTIMGFGCYETALRWLRELRRVMAAPDHVEKLGYEVEVDETPLGGVEKGGKRGPYVGKTWIIGAVERKGAGCGRVRLRVLKDNRRDGDTLCGFVQDVVDPSSIVYTDAAPSYGPLTSLGYVHDARTTTTGRGQQLKMEDGREKAGVHLPQIHKVFSLVERIIVSAYQGSFSERHLQGCLDEYSFRFNRRETSVPLGIFQALVKRATASQCVPLWKSRGRVTPDSPTRQVTNEWASLGTALQGMVYVG